MGQLFLKLTSVLQILTLTTKILLRIKFRYSNKMFESAKIPVWIKTLILTGISVVSVKSFETLKWVKTFNTNNKVVILKIVSKLIHE